MTLSLRQSLPRRPAPTGGAQTPLRLLFQSGQAVRQEAAIGRPLMDEATVRHWERTLDRPILPRKRGPEPKGA
ncbi:MAG: hypothetical protein L0H73_05460 [Nitrococcus sp.]|nr:hypothetical protein [Nitrococcus sp.]